MKATHSGTCQCCGSLQKLPGDLLSKHGYTVDHGYFEGVCRGAGYKPFEVSCDQVERYIREAKEALTIVKADIAKWSASLDREQVWFHVYHSSEGRWRKSGYSWELHPVACIHTKHYEASKSTGEFWSHTVDRTDLSDAEKRRHHVCGEIAYTPDPAQTIDKFIQKQNGWYLQRVLEVKRKRIEEYIKWQSARVKAWKPGELQAVKEGK